MQLFRALIALSILSASVASLAEESVGRAPAPSNLMFSIDGQDLGIFPIAVANGSNAAISYLHAAGRIQLSLGLPRNGRYLDPLFCFDQLGTISAVTLEANDPNGQRILDGIPLNANLSYILGNGEISYRPAPSAKCFYYGDNSGQFGLFGRAPAVVDENPEGGIFADRFEVDARVGIEYANLAGAGVPGEALNYQIIVTNRGTFDLTQVAFQEVAPTSSTAFDASVTPVVIATVDWTCVPSGAAVCPAASEDPNSLRFSGVSLPAGSSLTFNVNRSVNSGSQPGSFIDLHAGVVAGSGTNAVFDTASAVVPVLGSAENVAYTAQPQNVIAGTPMSPVVVGIFDEFGNLIESDSSTSIQLRLYQNGSAIDKAFANSLTVNGTATFSNLILNTPGTGYSFLAVAILPDLSAASEMSQSFAVAP